MGLYINECKRMQYKATIPNSYLLCPYTRHFYPIDQLHEQLDDFASCFEPDSEKANYLHQEYVNDVMDCSQTWVIFDHEFNALTVDGLVEKGDERINAICSVLPRMPKLNFLMMIIA